MIKQYGKTRITTYGWDYMRIDCLHGYFKFYESRSGDISRFMSIFSGLSIFNNEDHYTFEALLEAPEYSILGNEYLGATATKTYSGKPWEIFRENGLAYDFNKGIVQPIASITQVVKIYESGNTFISQGLILPGSFTDEGGRVTDYSAWFLFDSLKFKYSELTID